MQIPVLLAAFRRFRWPIAIVCAVVAIFSMVATRDLPVPSCYEVRYEVRLLGMNLPDTPVKDLVCINPEDVCVRLREAARSSHCSVDVWCDKTYKVTIRVRDNDAATAEQIARSLYGELEGIHHALLNDATASRATLTPARWLVVGLALLGALLLSLLFVALRAFSSVPSDSCNQQ